MTLEPFEVLAGFRPIEPKKQALDAIANVLHENLPKIISRYEIESPGQDDSSWLEDRIKEVLVHIENDQTFTQSVIKN